MPSTAEEVRAVRSAAAARAVRASGSAGRGAFFAGVMLILYGTGRRTRSRRAPARPLKRIENEPVFGGVSGGRVRLLESGRGGKGLRLRRVA